MYFSAPDNCRLRYLLSSMSFPPMPVQQHAFEEICTYLMTDLVKREHHISVPYIRYGRNGQNQCGLDLVTHHPKFAPIVGQCKHRQPGVPLKTKEVMDDLAKTNDYQLPIEKYFVLTNSERDVGLQNALVGYEHQRPDGTKFSVQLIYWEQLQRNLSFIPKDKLRLYFPEQAEHAKHFFPPPNMEAVVAAYEMAPSVLQEWFTEDDINEIECSPGTLRLSPNLWQKMNLFQQAMDSARWLGRGMNANAERPCVCKLFRALPAIDAFARILYDFKSQISSLEGLNPRDLTVMQLCEGLRDSLHKANPGMVAPNTP